MRENIYIILAALCIIALMILIATIDTRPCPLNASAKMIDADPDYLSGKEVRLSTKGTEIGKNDRELIFRRRTDAPPTTIFHMRDSVSKIPDFIRGKILTKQSENDITIVVECIPCD